MHSCEPKKCQPHSAVAEKVFFRSAFTVQIGLTYSKEERDKLYALVDSSMLPDELGLSVLDDETVEVIDQAFLVSRYYKSEG